MKPSIGTATPVKASIEYLQVHTSLNETTILLIAAETFQNIFLEVIVK